MQFVFIFLFFSYSVEKLRFQNYIYYLTQFQISKKDKLIFVLFS